MNKENIDKRMSFRERLKQRLSQNQPSPDRHLSLLMEKSELEINLDNVIIFLRDSYNQEQYLQGRCQLLIKFIDKALQVLGKPQEWLDEIKKLIEEYENRDLNAPAILYFLKYRCLNTVSVSHPKSESCINKAIALETDIYRRIDYQLGLAMYYENSSQYQKMKNVISRCEILCRQNLNLDKQLARTLLYFGHYYFYTFDFDKSIEYLNRSKNIFLDLLRRQKNQKKKRQGNPNFYEQLFSLFGSSFFCTL